MVRRAEILRTRFIDIRILKLLLWYSIPLLNIGFRCLMLLHGPDADHREEGKATSLIMFCFFAASPFLDVL
jgi:hypothetical protein